MPRWRDRRSWRTDGPSQEPPETTGPDASGAASCVGAGADSCAGAADSWAGADSCLGAEDSAPEGDSAEACGLSAGGASGGPPDSEGAFSAALLLLVIFAAELALTVLPGNAWAATSAKTPVSRTLPAISQRLMRPSWERAASRVWVV